MDAVRFEIVQNVCLLFIITCLVLFSAVFELLKDTQVSVPKLLFCSKFGNNMIKSDFDSL